MSQFEEEAAPCRFFFRKENRILKRADFLRVYGDGKVYRRGLVHVFVLKVDAPVTRLGITATRKTGKAVRRNRGRRLVREVFRHALPDMVPGYDIVVNVTRNATIAPYTKLEGQLRDIWRQAGILKGGDAPPQPATAPLQPESHQ